jgi:hypothetical protein
VRPARGSRSACASPSLGGLGPRRRRQPKRRLGRWRWRRPHWVRRRAAQSLTSLARARPPGGSRPGPEPSRGPAAQAAGPEPAGAEATAQAAEGQAAMAVAAGAAAEEAVEVGAGAAGAAVVAVAEAVAAGAVAEVEAEAAEEASGRSSAPWSGASAGGRRAPGPSRQLTPAGPRPPSARATRFAACSVPPVPTTASGAPEIRMQVTVCYLRPRTPSGSGVSSPSTK